MVHAMYMSMGLKHDYRNALQQVSTPVPVLYGQNDLQPESASRQYANPMPQTKFRIIAGAGHLAFDELPAAFAQTVDEFPDSAK